MANQHLKSSQFINFVSGSSLPTGDSLRSVTQSVQTSRPFSFGGRTVTLIDTPGFDDTLQSDSQILSMIAAFLATS